MMKRKGLRAALCFAIVIAFTVMWTVFCPHGAAEGTVSVTTAQELATALDDSTVKEISISADQLQIDSAIEIKHAVAVNGTGTLSFGEDGVLRVADGTTFKLGGVTLESSQGYAVETSGIVELGERVTIAGDKGVLIKKGGSLTSGQYTVNVSATVTRAVGVSTGGGSTAISGLRLEHPVGSGTMVYIAPEGGSLLLGGIIEINTLSGTGIASSANDIGTDITAGDGGTLTVTAPLSKNPSGEDNAGAAIDIRNNSFTAGKDSIVSVTGSDCGILASSIVLEDGAVINANCSRKARSDSSGRALAALSTAGMIKLKSGAAVNVGASGAASCNGMYAAKGFELGDGAVFTMRGDSEQYSAMYTPETTVLASGTGISIKNTRNGIITENGMTTGDKCTIDISGVRGYGIYATGTLQANKLYFDTDNSIDINAGYCAIYTKESVNFCEGSQIKLSAGSDAPAIWIAADNDSQGHLSVNGASLSVTSSAGSTANGNAGIYVVGVINIEDGATIKTVNSGDFGMISAYGDILVSEKSSLYASGSCGIYLLGGNLRVNAGGKLFAEGRMDSAVRVEQGVVNCGDDTVIDAQGARFGIEIIGSGGVWITRAAAYDIRSTVDRAIYIENGSLNISEVDRLSVWKRSADGENAKRWWSGVSDGGHSWDTTAAMKDENRAYADHTILQPAITQHYSGGVPAEGTGGGWFNGSWSPDDYSRFSMYKTLPVARDNQFNIPVGKSFSWWLYGESYDGLVGNYSLVSYEGEGTFVLDSNGRFTYTAPGFARGAQSFKFTVTNNEGVVSVPATVEIFVTASKPPIACGNTFVTGMGKKLIEQLEMIDYDGVISETRVTEQPKHGTLLLASDGQFSYTPDSLFSGVDSFAYCAVDDMGDESHPGYVTIAVGQENELIASNFTLITESGVPVSARLGTMRSVADSAAESAADEEGEAEPSQPGSVTYEITGQPTYGILEFTDTDTIQYTPYEDFAGTDIIKYVAVREDGMRSNEAVITIAMIPNQRPSARSFSYTCVKNSTCRGELLAEDVDGTIVKYEILSQPEGGEVTVDWSTGEFVFKAKRGFLGKTSFTYAAQDNDGLYSKETTIAVEVTTLLQNLKDTGRLAAAVLAAIGLLAGAVVFIVTVAVGNARRRREEQLEEEKERLITLMSKTRARDDTAEKQNIQDDQ